jgi:hypothetical protein
LKQALANQREEFEQALANALANQREELEQALANQREGIQSLQDQISVYIWAYCA